LLQVSSEISEFANAQALTQLEKERLMAERLAKASKREMYPTPNSQTLQLSESINHLSKSFEHRSLETGRLAEGGSKSKEA